MRHCSRKRPPPPPSDSASYNIYVQPPLPPPQHKLQCMHSVYAPLLQEKGHHHRHHTVQVTILRPNTTTTTTVTITMHAFTICTIVVGKKQTTSASYCGLGPTPAPFRAPHVPRSTCAQWLQIKTTSVSYRGSKTTPPPLECTMQQALVTCIRACH